jgi:flagellar biosynthesis protein FliR
MDIFVSQFIVFILLFVRIGALIAVAPVLGHSNVPLQVKIAIGLFISYVMYPLIIQSGPVIDTALIPFALMAVQEVIVGLLIGFAMALIFAGVQYAGNIMAFNMGLYFANVFDPESSQQIPVLSTFMYLFTMLIFVLVNGHHAMIQALLLSYASAPIGEFALSGGVLEGLVNIGGMMFVTAVMLSAPILVALFLVNVGFGLLARVVPRMNVFIISFPLKIGMGMVILLTTMPMLAFVFKKILTGFQNNLLEMIAQL